MKPLKFPVDKKEKKMTYEQLANEIGIENAFKAFDRANLTEKAAAADPMTRGGKKVKPNSQLTVVQDLILTQLTANDFSSTLSENAQWFSYQVFVDMTTNDGAYAIGNHYYDTMGSAPENEPCTITTSGFVRTFTSDFDYTIHLSNVIAK